MAMQATEITLGVDVSKDELVICDWDSKEIIHLVNDSTKIQVWLKSLVGPVRIAIEPTSSYHLKFVEQAHALGMAIYIVNPRQVKHYREVVNERNKTDPADALLLARFLDRESSSLRPFTPQCAKAEQLWSLLKRRAATVKARTMLNQSFAEIRFSTRAVLTEIERVLKRIDLRMLALVRELGWWDDYRRCRTIPGVGPLNAMALVSAFNRGAFAGADAFVSFIGLDIRVRESGKYKGQSKISKRGESEIRRLLYCATQGAQSYLPFDNYYQARKDQNRCQSRPGSKNRQNRLHPVGQSRKLPKNGDQH